MITLANILIMLLLFGAFLMLLWMILNYFGGKFNVDKPLIQIVFGIIALISFIYVFYNFRMGFRFL